MVYRFQLPPTSLVKEVDGVPTPTLEAFAAAVQGKADGESVRLKQEDLRGVKSVSSLKLDLTYWPTYEVCRDKVVQGEARPGGRSDNRLTWSRRLVAPADAWLEK